MTGYGHFFVRVIGDAAARRITARRISKGKPDGFVHCTELSVVRFETPSSLTIQNRSKAPNQRCGARMENSMANLVMAVGFHSVATIRQRLSVQSVAVRRLTADPLPCAVKMHRKVSFHAGSGDAFMW